MTLTFDPGQDMVMAHTQTKTQVLRLVGSKVRVETSEQTDAQTKASDCFTFPANAVGNKC